MRIRAHTTILGLTNTDGIVHRRTVFRIDLEHAKGSEAWCNGSGTAGSAAYLRLEEDEWQGQVSVFRLMRDKHQPQRPSRRSCIKTDRIFLVVMGTFPASLKGLVEFVTGKKVSQVS